MEKGVLTANGIRIRRLVLAMFDNLLDWTRKMDELQMKYINGEISYKSAYKQVDKLLWVSWQRVNTLYRLEFRLQRDYCHCDVIELTKYQTIYQRLQVITQFWA